MAHIYCTPNDVAQRIKDTNLAALLDRSGTTNLTRDARLSMAVDEANSFVDTYVRRQHDLPLRETPAFLTGIACFLAYWNILDSSREKKSDSDRERYTDCINTLTDIAEHKIDLPFVSRTESNLSASVGIAITNKTNQQDGKVFGDSSLSPYIKDIR